MAVQAFSNVNLVNGLCAPCANGFVPVATYVFDPEAKTVTVTNASTIPTGDTFAKMKVTVTDKFGNEIKNAGTSAGTAVVVSTASLVASEPFDLQVTIFTTAKLFADGGAYNLQLAGDVAHFDKSN